MSSFLLEEEVFLHGKQSQSTRINPITTRFAGVHFGTSSIAFRMQLFLELLEPQIPQTIFDPRKVHNT